MSRARWFHKVRRPAIAVSLVLALAITVWSPLTRAMALDTLVKISVRSTLSNDLDLAVAAAPTLADLNYTWATGTGANQADKVFSDQRTVNASANEDLDLAGVLTDALNQSLTFAKVKAIYVKASASNANNVQVTRPASNGVPWLLAAGDGIALRPGATFIWISPDATGVSVTAGTGDLINVANSGGGTSVVYDIIIIGTS